MKFEDFGLTQDPFPIAPESSVHNWAGDQELREDLVDLVHGVRARDIGVSEFAVLWGELGAGKSHALMYLRTLIREDTENFNSLAIYLPRPQVANKLSFMSIAKRIFEDITRDKITDYCEKISEILDRNVQRLAEEKGMGDQKDKSTFMEAALNLLDESNRPMVALLARGSKPGAKVYEFLTGQAKCDGPEYEFKIDSDFLAAKVLGEFFRVLALEFPDGSRVHESVYLFIDESEMLLDAKPAESDAVFTGLRELINSLPYRFGLLMSFTAATALIEAVMHQHLVKRMTRSYIEVPMMDDEQALEFLRSQLDFFREEGSSYKGTFYPFSDEAVGIIVGNELSTTPRNLFIQCKRVFERAIRRFGVEPGEEISGEVAAKILNLA